MDGSELPLLLASRLEALLDCGPDTFHEHFDLMTVVAEELEYGDALVAAARQLLADPRGDVRALCFDLLCVATVGDDKTLVPELVRAAADPGAQGGEDLRWSVAQALAAADDDRVLDALLAFEGDEDGDVRWQVVSALPIAGRPLPRRGVDALLRLMRDVDSGVRDWATFTLGVLDDADGPEIRSALVERLDDDDPTAAAETAVGLARRKHLDVLPVIAAHLDDEVVGTLYVEAAAEIGDPTLLAALRRLEADGWAQDESSRGLLAEALGSCGA